MNKDPHLTLAPPDDAVLCEDAAAPADISWRGWGQIAVAAVRAGLNHKTPSTAAAASFYGLLAFIPAVAAFGASFGYIAGPRALNRQLEAFDDLVPLGVLDLVHKEAARFAQGDSHRLLSAAAFFTLVAVVGASSSVRTLMNGLNTIYRAEETRSFIHRRILSFVFAAGIVAALAADIALVIRSGDFAVGERTLIWPLLRLVLRWASLFAVSVVALTLVYRYGPDRRLARWRWVTPGSMMAASVGLLTSAGMSVYLAQFAHYERTYGGLGSVLALVIWMWASMIVVLGGAELNFAIECKTSAVTDISSRVAARTPEPDPRP